MDSLSKEQARAALAALYPRYYVYHLVGVDGQPFYVGQGRGNRVFVHELDQRAAGVSEKLDLIRACTKSPIGLRYRLLGPFESQAEAHDRELSEIARLGRRISGGVLTNLTEGGPGARGTETGSKDVYGERGIANRFMLQFITAESLPIRPVSTFDPKALRIHRVRRALTKRQAGALVASAIANNVSLEGACEIPRRMVVAHGDKSVELAIENGAGCSILETASATLVTGKPSGYEIFRLNPVQVKAAINLVPPDLLAHSD